MKFIADFHIHSKYSRATAKTLDFEHLYVAAQIKGITVIGTGDFTHPAWFSEISEKLVPAEPGLFKLRDDLATECAASVPDACKQPVRFILTTEISNIYKKNDKTRKNHNLVFFPELASVAEFNKRLDAIGNINSDGRPILGLDARHLLEIMLEVDDTGFLVPAHIWTPWFSLLGSKSGFDSMEECYEDLSEYIFAAETGLSSDPAMNWRLSGLDNITLISNSDAHSPFTLGREANRFETELSFSAIKDALKSGDPEKFLGTFEFYPEEGKYHFDGHRKCDVCCHPKESIDHKGLCPVCQKPMTLGVLYRVEELADREEGTRPHTAHDYHSIIPLTDILSDILMVGPKSKKVATHFDQAVSQLGPEFDILHKLTIDDLNRSSIPLLGEAVHRMRTGKIHLSPGYDGEFGKVKIFSSDERDTLMGQKALFDMPAVKNRRGKKKPKLDEWQIKTPASPEKTPPPAPQQTLLRESSATFDLPKDILEGLNSNQKQAVLHNNGPLLISAGPGTGKTRTLTHRIAYLISEKNINPENIVALTFTHKAAGEMKERLTNLLSGKSPLPFISTFHGFCNDFLCDQGKIAGLPAHTIAEDKEQKLLVSAAIELSGGKNDCGVSVDRFAHLIMTAKQSIIGPEDDPFDIGPEADMPLFSKIYQQYQDLLNFQNISDYEDLIYKTVKILETDPETKRTYQQRFPFIFIDEYQDLNHGQYRLIKLLSPSGNNLCVIGDPNQAIYGFRGSDPAYFKRFMTDFPEAKSISLTQNYRSAETILGGSAQIIQSVSDQTQPLRIYSGINGIDKMGVIASATEKSEAVAIGKLIEKMVGGIGFHSMDLGINGNAAETKERSFSDFAVLYRTKSQGRLIADVLEKANIPCKIASKDSFVDEKGIRELLALFRLTQGHGSIFDFELVARIPGSEVGTKTLKTFRQWFFENKNPLSKALSKIRRLPVKQMTTNAQLKLDRFIARLNQTNETIKDLSVATKLDHLSKLPIVKRSIDKNPKAKDLLPKLFNMASPFEDDSALFCANLALQDDNDFYDSRSEKVALMTLHASKGLEFPVVFISGCEQGLIPYHRNRFSDENELEERRLFYVAMTRAEEDLYFTWSKKRKIHGKTEPRTLSPYVSEIEEQLIRDEASAARKKAAAQSQLTLF